MSNRLKKAFVLGMSLGLGVWVFCGCGAASTSRNAEVLSRIKPIMAAETKCDESQIRATCVESTALGACVRWGLAGCNQKTLWKLEKDDAWVCEESGQRVLPPGKEARLQKRSEKEARAQAEMDAKAQARAEKEARAQERKAAKAPVLDAEETPPQAAPAKPTPVSPPVDDDDDDDVPLPEPVDL
ncbi:MAG: hypothetical protein M0R76_08580 [Proteobacteria bacterium]|nr:hypothetical protein [Pseudomonadota bacterium]